MIPPRLFVVCLPFLVLVGCQKSEVTYYKVPKEKAAPSPHGSLPPAHPSVDQLPASHPPIDQTPAGSAMNTQTSGAVSSENLAWTPPPHWQKKPLGQMRRGSFAIKGEGAEEADLSIFVFPGAAGGLLDNVNRWRGQIGLGPLDAAKLADECTSLKTSTGLDITVVDMTGSNQERILGAILPRGAESWFFKLKGPASLLGKEKNAFIEFLKSVKTP